MKRIKIVLALVFMLIFTSTFVMAVDEVTIDNGTDIHNNLNQGIYGSGNSGGLTNSGNSGVTFKDSFNGADPIRYLPVPNNVSVSTRGGPAYFGGPPKDNGPHFMSLRTLVNAMNAIDLSVAKIDDEVDIEFVSQVISSVSDEDKEKFKDEKPKFYLLEQKDVTKMFDGNFTTLVVTTMKADDNDTMNSATLAVKIMQEAEKYGAKKIVLVSEGTTKRMSSWGVGIGFSQNYGFVNSDSNGSGGASAGGTGWSWGESEFFSLPYMTAILGY
ncbi:hypothetical protein DRQ25_10605 [Candidatus Fermentibacteria bacterium]|nr:MAG: hypothetical protein DRQ25_10605 [Candidatus Fermentibacteria bacterium]